MGLSWLPFGGPCGGFLGVCGLALVSFGFPLGALGRLRAPFGRCWALLGRAFDRFWVASVSLCSFRDGFWVAGVCLGNLCFQQPADHTPGDLPWVGGLIVFKTYYIELLASDVFFLMFLLVFSGCVSGLLCLLSLFGWFCRVVCCVLCV